ncbi:MAG: sugar phosphate isomerase/epimerase [Planctomycetes bacterium]|nr:sugar phosphate isomerase/epimerase [Planctomycetota bacterium]MBL6910008.1 sugar phosphate isomerase/epimerase [Pirellulales bacterium]RZO65395.1 MAG: sugar phosphate isomerase/epimerase [Phycisphaeraceae bacterium]HAO72655.1 xylose isomerase [Planctomycetaceae bacterium]HAU48318.1 xylose isomerase [Planctomycetaceae bacterium]
MFMVTQSRRSFMTSAAAGIVGIPLIHAAAPAPPKFSLGIQAFSLRKYSLDDALRHTKELGFDAIEFYPKMFPVTNDLSLIKTVLQKVRDQGLTISAHGVNKFTADSEANRKVFSFAKQAGIKTLTADPSADSFDNLEELVQEFDIRVAIHNHGPGHRYSKVLDVLQAIENRDQRIGACADLGHYIRSAERPVEVIRLLKGRLYGIHLKDVAEMQKKTEGVILGQGHLDVPAVFAALDQVGFPEDGALSLEYEKNPDSPLNDIRQCVAIARNAMAS